MTKITVAELIKALNLPEGTQFYIDIPGGGDYSNCEFQFSELKIKPGIAQMPKPIVKDCSECCGHDSEGCNDCGNCDECWCSLVGEMALTTFTR